MDSALAEKEGFRYDRRWMLVDSNGRFLSQREHNEMSLFSCSITDSSLEIEYDGDKISIPLDQETNTHHNVTVWDHTVSAAEVNPIFSDWFSDKLKQSCKLVRMTDSSERIKDFKKPPFKSKVSFADGYPYLLLGTASMDELNNRMDTALNINRFRPNIVVDTSIAHEEDEWEDIQASGAHLRIVKPCARCVVTTINQETGVAGKEPLKTLASYRRWDNQVFFGANAILLSPGVINKDDQILLP